MKRSNYRNYTKIYIPSLLFIFLFHLVLRSPRHFSLEKFLSFIFSKTGYFSGQNAKKNLITLRGDPVSPLFRRRLFKYGVVVVVEVMGGGRASDEDEKEDKWRKRMREVEKVRSLLSRAKRHEGSPGLSRILRMVM